jgi:hypothetical protein
MGPPPPPRTAPSEWRAGSLVLFFGAVACMAAAFGVIYRVLISRVSCTACRYVFRLFERVPDVGGPCRFCAAMISGKVTRYRP